MITKTNYRATAIAIFIHVLALSVGFSILAAVFEFPDVLRETAVYRLTLFTEQSRIVIPTYYLLALTGLTQIIVSLLLHHALNDNKSSLLLVATTFGILTGIFQTLGFIRWPILVPYLAEAMNGSVPMETIAFVEGAFNRYAGMAVGEHLGFLGLAAWTMLLGIVMVRHPLFDKSLGWAGIIIGLLSFPMSLEPLGGFLTIFGELTYPLNGAWLIWLVVMGISLLRTDTVRHMGMRLGWKTAVISTIAWVIAVAPAYVG
jgi:hypothetical protein